MCNIDKEKLDSIIEAFKSSDIQKCIDLGFDEGVCKDPEKWYAAIIASSSYKENKANISGFYLVEKKEGRIIITHNDKVYKLLCPDSIKYAISSKEQNGYHVADIIPLEDADGLEVVKDLSPVCCGFVSDEAQKKLIALFNSSQSSRRVFNEVHYYPNGDPFITIGFGHFAEKSLTEFFENREKKVLDKMIDFMLFLLYNYEVGNTKIIDDERSDETLCNNRDIYKDQIMKDLDIKNEKDVKDKLTEFFSGKDYTKWWKKKYEGEKDKNGNPKGLEIPGGKLIGNWFNDLLRYALLLEDVCEYQVKFWEKNVYKGSITKATDIGYNRTSAKNNNALIAQLMSWKSSGWADYKGYKDNKGTICNFYGKQMIDGKPNESDKYRLNDKGVINKSPTSNFNNEYKIIKYFEGDDKVKVQEEILVAEYDTKTGKKREETIINEEKQKINGLLGSNNEHFDSLAVLLMWLSYNHFKDKIRPRQKAIWDLFLKDVWDSDKDYPDNIYDIKGHK